MSIETQILITAFSLFSIIGAAAISMGVAVKNSWMLFATWAFLVSALMILTSFVIGSWFWGTFFSLTMVAAITYMVMDTRKGI